MVCILRITNPFLGSFVKDKLESERIDCYFTNEGLKLGSEYNPNEVLLKVKASQSEPAVKTLLQIHKDYDLDKISEDKTLQNIKKILAPIKLKKSNYPLIQYALSLAKKINAEIKFLYVYEDPSIAENKKHTASWEKHVQIELMEAHAKAQKELVEFSIAMKKDMPADLIGSVKFHYRMLKGTPEYVISDTCERNKPDMVLMGTGKATEENDKFMDKMVIKATERCSFPVLAVPDSVVFSEKKKLNVMYATNFYNSDNSSLNRLLTILEPFEKEIHCVHIALHDDPNHVQKVAQLNKTLKEEYAGHNIKCKLFESDDIVKGLTNFVDENNVDLISLSKQRRSAFYKMFHSNILGKLLITKKVPVLIFPV